MAGNFFWALWASRTRVPPCLGAPASSDDDMDRGKQVLVAMVKREGDACVRLSAPPRSGSAGWRLLLRTDHTQHVTVSFTLLARPGLFAPIGDSFLSCP
jgi:hypothetical protein